MSCARRPSRPAFTLIEVLLTSVLAAALLAGLFALLSMHLKLFDSGQTKTEQTQLARTLLRQMSDDLHSIAQAPPLVPLLPILPPLPITTSGPAPAASSQSSSGATSSPSAPTPVSAGPPAAPVSAPTTPLAGAPTSNALSGPSATSTVSASPAFRRLGGAAAGQSSVMVTSSLRPSGLLGTEKSLQIDIAQPAIVSDEEIDPRDFPPGADHPSRAPELRTIVYVFEDGSEQNHPVGEPRTRLVRREISWEQAHAARGGGRRADPPGIGVDGADAGSAGIAGGAPSPGMAAPRTTPIESPTDETNHEQSNTTESAPEVVDFGMRYFDGSRWSLEWDSVARKGLPRAIEVAMQLRAFDEPEAASNHSANESTTDDQLARQPRLPIYRLLIYLPATTQPAPSESERGLGGSFAGGSSGAKRPLGAESNGSRR